MSPVEGKDRASLSVLAWSIPLALETTQRKQMLSLFGSGLQQSPQIHRSAGLRKGRGLPGAQGVVSYKATSLQAFASSAIKRGGQAQ